MSVENKVMLISLSISVFTGEKVDRDVTDQVASQHNTTSYDAGRFTKQIISKQALEPIRRTASAARAMHYDRTVPFNDRGERLLSVVGYLPYVTDMRALRIKFTEHVDLLCEIYPRLIDQARKRLNGMFNVEDYPPTDTLRNRFSFLIAASPLPDTQNWVMDMAEDAMSGLRSHYEEQKSHGIQLAVTDVYKRIAEVTAKLRDKLSDPEAIFRDSLIENVARQASLIPSLNVTDDPQLAALALELTDLTKYSASALRAEPEFRKAIAAQAQSVFDKAGMFM